MIKDENNIAVFTCVIVMIAMGMVLQRAESVSNFFDFGESKIALHDDVVNARINSLVRVDVLANDNGVSRDADADVQLISQPKCGHAVVRNGTIEFLANTRCRGVQTIEYSVKGTSEVATIAAQVIAPPEKEEVIAEAAPARAEPVARSQDATAGAASGTAGAVEMSSDDDVPAAEADDLVTKKVASAVDLPARSENVPALRSDAEVANAGDVEAEDISATAAITQPPLEPFAPTGGADTITAVAAETVTATAADADAPRELIIAMATTAEDAPAAVEAEITEARVAEPTFDAGSTLNAEPIIGADTVRRLSGASPVVPQGGEINDAELVALARSGGNLTVTAPKIAPLKLGTDRQRSKAGNSGLLSAFGFGAGDEADGAADVMMMVIDRGYAGMDTPVVPAYGLVSEPAVPSDAQEARLSKAGSDGIALAALSTAPSQATPAAVGEALSVAPVDPYEAPYEAPAPKEQETVVARLSDEAETAETSAAVAPAQTTCVVPPTVSMAPQRAAQTTLTIEAPCQPGTVAEINYSKLSLAVALNENGTGEITVPGFEAFAPATISFANGESLDVELPFRDVQRVSRVAIAWNAPVAIELNALEFGANFGDETHISPANPRGYHDIRKSGGGYLTQHARIGDTGQNVQIYTHLHRLGGATGVVKMMIDFASRSRDGLAEACGDGPHAAPMFDVLRVDRGDRQRRTRRQLASVECSKAAQADQRKSLISGAVEDLLITPR